MRALKLTGHLLQFCFPKAFGQAGDTAVHGILTHLPKNEFNDRPCKCAQLAWKFRGCFSGTQKNSRGIVCFTETWLDSSYSQMSLQVDGFHPAFRHDRVGKRGGGVAVYVSAVLVVKRLNDMELPESVFLEIVLSKSRRLLLVACYRPPINVKAE